MVKFLDSEKSVLKNGLFFIEKNTELVPIKDWIEHLF